jgi:hypothetical protein
VPFGTAALAAGIVQSKVREGSLQKPVLNATHAKGGFTANDEGNADLVDLQYLGFNAVLLLYFVVALIQDRHLPDLPLALVGLTGVGAAAYVAKKGIERNPPVIDSASVAGVELRVRGKNLLPPVDESGERLSSDAMREYVVVDGVVTDAVTWTDDGLVNAQLASSPQAGARVILTTLGGHTAEATIGP